MVFALDRGKQWTHFSCMDAFFFIKPTWPSNNIKQNKRYFSLQALHAIFK